MPHDTSSMSDTWWVGGSDYESTSEARIDPHVAERRLRLFGDASPKTESPVPFLHLMQWITQEFSVSGQSTVQEWLANAVPSLPRPVVATIDGKTMTFSSVREKFDALSDAWRDSIGGRAVVGFQSSSYMQIIGMGQDAIPLILARVAQGEGNWHLALKSIAGEIADGTATLGNAQAVREAWLEWGKANGFTWESAR